jgi:hypothetical protein
MLPVDPKARKDIPLARGVLDYFPDALCAVAELSRIGNEQHNPGQPLHWAKEKSTDHADCIIRHLADRGHLDADGVRHSAKVAWRALALLQIELEDAEKRRADYTSAPYPDSIGKWERPEDPPLSEARTPGWRMKWDPESQRWTSA